MLASVRAIAREAGDVVMRHYARLAHEGAAVDRKPDDSPVTAADRASNALIVERLRALSPDIPVVAEESDLPPYSVRAYWTRFWLVDPLDGTKEYLARNGEFTVNIALVENGEPVLGVVHAPAFAVTYYGAKGTGAWKAEGEEPSQRLISRPLPPGLPLTVLVSRSHADDLDLERLLPGREVARVHSVGSALKFGLLAEGVGDVYVRTTGTMEWDVAAGDAVWRNATAAGEPQRSSPFTYNKPDVTNEGFVLGLEP
jgi:3'(2'), 5'-bisphosphate nucleotidase